MNYAIIAAGEGSRLRNEGVAAPKPLVPLNGRPMIGRLIDIFLKCNAETISVIVNEQMTEVADYLRELAPTLPVELKLVVKSTPSSMHSFYEVSRHFSGKKFILTTVDTIFREDDFRRYAEAFEAANDNDGMMALTTFIDDEKPLYVDAVVSNPPYSQHWDPTDAEMDPRFKEYGVAPKSKADYAFLLHELQFHRFLF